MKVNEVFDFLDQEEIDFEILNSISVSDEIDLKFFSLRSPKNGGIYFNELETIDIPYKTLSNSILFCKKKFPDLTETIQIKVDNPQLVHYKLSSRSKEKRHPHIHSTAIISSEAKIGKDVSIGPYSIIGACQIEDGVEIRNNVTIEDNCYIGHNTVIDSNSVIGAEGLAWIWDENGQRIRQPQTGGVIIGSECYLGTDVTIVRGSLYENTMIGDGTLIAHGSKIGHGSVIESNVHLANNVSLAGSSHIMNRAFLGSACVISPHITVSEGTIVGAGAVVTKNFNEKYLSLAGVPAKIVNFDNRTKKPKGAPKTH